MEKADGECRRPFNVTWFYFTFSQKRMRIAAASARVAVPLGARVVAVRPVIRPSALL